MGNAAGKGRDVTELDHHRWRRGRGRGHHRFGFLLFAASGESERCDSGEYGQTELCALHRGVSREKAGAF
jgi:hypothetical protein